MSALFNQTNLAPGSAFATGTGSNTSNFPSGITLGQNSMVPSADTINVNVSQFNIVDSGNSPSVLQLTGGEMLMYDPGTGAQYPILLSQYDPNPNPNLRLSYNFVNTINSKYTVGSSTAGRNFIQYGANQLDGAGSYTVSMPDGYSNGTNYTVLLTQTSGAPTQIPWAKITSSNSFEIAGDSNATISWLAMGQ